MREQFTNPKLKRRGREYNEFIDEDTNEIVYVDKNKLTIYIYILYKDGTPIYVGKTTNIKSRIQQHKNIKRDFDSYRIAFEYDYEVTANITEKVLISFLKDLYPNLLNKSSITLCGEIIKLKRGNK